jgi:hypothetical protein
MPLAFNPDALHAAFDEVIAEARVIRQCRDLGLAKPGRRACCIIKSEAANLAHAAKVAADRVAARAAVAGFCRVMGRAA